MDHPLPVRTAPGPDVDDVGNAYDTDATSDAVMEHNARYRAACPKKDAPGPVEGVARKGPGA